MNSNTILKCFYVPPLWLLITNRLSWSLGAIFIIIALVEIVGQIAIRDKIFVKQNKIIILIMVLLILIAFATSAYIYYTDLHFNNTGLDC